jgi:hypothetical protein
MKAACNNCLTIHPYQGGLAMSKHTPSARRVHTHPFHLSIAPTELQRLRMRLHTGEHVVLNQREVHTVLQMVDLIAPDEPGVPSARQPKPSYQRQQHRSVRNKEKVRW